MHIHLHIFFSTLYNDSLPNMLYHYVPFFFIPVDPFQLSYNLSLLFTSIHHPTFHIPHSMSSLVVQSIAEPKSNYFIGYFDGSLKWSCIIFFPLIINFKSDLIFF
jgi:hypothetical protein